MGQEQPVQKPSQANSTVLFIQQERVATGNWVCSGPCDPPQIPRWHDGQSPNQELIQRGLSADALRQEIESMNTKAIEYINNEHNTSHQQCYVFGVIIIVAILAGIVLAIASNVAWIALPIVVLFMSGLVAKCLIFAIKRRHRHTWNNCLNAIAYYIQNEVNPRYQSIGIAWSMTARDDIYAYYDTYKDIHITPLAPVQQTIAIQQPNIVYVDQNGNPIQPQQVIVVHQNGATAPPVAGAPQSQPREGTSP
eukprot:213623_1